jgi:MFS superfamily sulfate permease-like transporter
MIIPALTGTAKNLVAHPKADLLAGSVVFLVALPLCLGIAVACHAPPIAGIIAGICGGLVVPLVSRAQLSVCGPAAGLTAIVVAGIDDLGSFPLFLVAVFLGGVFQAVLGVVRAGALAAIVPSTVIKAMLSAIGIILIAKQISLVLGVPAKMIDVDFLVLSANRVDHFGQLYDAASPGAVIISILSVALIATWKKNPLAKISWMSSSLVVVLVGTLLSVVFEHFVSALALPSSQLINLPSVFDSGANFAHPDWSALRLSKTWTIGFTIALVASIETLLSIEALDRLDPDRRRTPKNRELLAQGLANMASGVLGGLPITAVIVRSSTNIQAGAKGQLSALFHGLLLVVAVVALAPVLDHVPTACLAAILLHVGGKLASPRVLREQLKLGYETWVPFLVTLIAVVATDLLKGVLLGFLVSILVVLKHATRDTVVMKREGNTVHVDFLRDGTFLVKPALVAILEDVRDGEHVILDCTNEFIDHDVREVLAAFTADAGARKITVELRGLDLDGVALSAH